MYSMLGLPYKQGPFTPTSKLERANKKAPVRHKDRCRNCGRFIKAGPYGYMSHLESCSWYKKSGKKFYLLHPRQMGKSYLAKEMLKHATLAKR